MKNLIKVFIFASLVPSFSFADLGSDLRDCRYSCNSSCESAISEAKYLIEEAVSSCRQRPDRPDRPDRPGSGDAFNECLSHLLNRGYDASSAGNICDNVSSSEFSCIKDLLNRGYDGNSARATCVR